MTAQSAIELYHWPTSNRFKITIMLEECGLPYEIKYVNIGAGEQFEPDFLKIAPNNRMPAIIDPDGPGGKPISVFESGGILFGVDAPSQRWRTGFHGHRCDDGPRIVFHG